MPVYQRSRSTLAEVFESVSSKSSELANSVALDWFNDLVSILWPHLNTALQKIIHDSVTPRLQKLVPYVLSGIRFEKFSLGSEGLRVKRVRVMQDPGGYRIVMSVELNCDEVISLAVGMANFGLKSLNISGDLIVSLLQLIDQMPVVGGVAFHFMDPPRLDYEFTGMLFQGIRTLPGVNSKLRNAIDSAIIGSFVVPNQYLMQLAEEEQGMDIALMKQPAPLGFLSITVKSAKDLQAGSNDKKFTLFGRSTNAFVELQVGGQVWTSSTVHDSCNPVWPASESTEMLFFDRDQKLFITVWNGDNLSKDAVIGHVEAKSISRSIKSSGVPLSLYNTRVGHSERQASIKRLDTVDHEDRCGQLTLDIKCFELNPMVSCTSSSTCILRAKIDEVYLPKVCGDEVKVVLTVNNTITQETYVEAVPQMTKTEITETDRVVRKVVSGLHSKGMSANDIAEVTLLDEKEVTTLIDNLNPAESVVKERRRAARRIEVEACLYMLLPIALLQAGTLEVSLSDREGNAVAQILKVPLATLLAQQEAAGLGQIAMSGPFRLAPTKALENLNVAVREAELELKLSLLGTTLAKSAPRSTTIAPTKISRKLSRTSTFSES
eukprot:TRINITY_DN74347_c0_g1_i1.p1 TRINITY_DN74347_c0_g1~~TRINITY_DN74347_c0_g1_i1.p1  ORF type:complete len:648 (-),score=112.48 TRINITY_DN74347_c0_g1_i1:121-1938(-)